MMELLTHDIHQYYFSSLNPYKKTNNRVTSFYINDILGDSLSEDLNKKKKKKRTIFTRRQIFELEKKFENKKYLTPIERTEMASLLTVTETQIKIWFQNRRTKWKKNENISHAEAAEHKLTARKLSKSSNNDSSSRKSSTCSSIDELIFKPPTLPFIYLSHFNYHENYNM